MGTAHIVHEHTMRYAYTRAHTHRDNVSPFNEKINCFQTKDKFWVADKMFLCRYFGNNISYTADRYSRRRRQWALEKRK